MNPFDKDKYPYCHKGHQYALDVVSGLIPNCIYVIGACKRYLKDYETYINSEFPRYYFRVEKAEKFLRIVQKFEHVKGEWEPKNIVYQPWQCFVFMNIKGWYDSETGHVRFRMAHIDVGRGAGKAHPIDELVPTPKGLLKWGEVEIGTELYGRDGKVCKVIGKTPITSQKEYKVIFSDGSEVRCSLEHEWFTSTKLERGRKTRHTNRPPIRKDINPTYESVRELKEIKNTLDVRGEKNHTVSMTKPIVGSKSIKDFIDPYYVGYWLGNGSKGSAELSCHSNDYIELMSILKERGVPCHTEGYQKPGNGKTIRVLENYVKLREIDLLNNKHIKPEWLDLKYDERLELLRGLLDSDGSIDESGIVEFYSSDYELARYVRLLSCSFGFKATLKEKILSENNNYKSNKKHYRVSFTARGDIRLFNLERKYKRQISKMGGHTYANKRYIIDVVETGNYVDMFCVEVDSIDNSYLISETYIPTHNSAMASQTCLYDLCCDDPKGNTISCVATKKDQARIVLDSARAMAIKNKSFCESKGVVVRAHDIVHPSSFSEIKALSSDKNGLDGLNDKLAVCDELHAMSGEVFDLITSGMSKRADSLVLCITTAGFNVESVGYSQRVYAQKVCLGEVEDDTFFAIVYTIDEGDDIYSEVTWRKANPGYGVSVDPITFYNKAMKTKEVPRDLPNFKVKHLNVWLSESKAYYDQAKWDLCADTTIKFEDFYNKKCYVGIDLASKIDLTSIAYVFYNPEDKKYYIFDRTFIPYESAQGNSLYQNCIGTGHLIETPGEAIHLPNIQDDFFNYSRKVKIQEAYYDPWNATEFGQRMTKERINMVEFRMNTANFSEPTKQLDALIRQGRIVHNGSPLLRWCLGNVVCKEDAAGNVFPRKSHEKLKIDPIISIIMALAGHIREMENQSVYETRGIRRIG